MANGLNKKFFDFDLLKRVLRFSARYRRRFYWSIAFAVILAAFTPVRPILIQLTVDKYIAGDTTKSYLNGFSITQMLVLITIIQIVFLCLEPMLRFYFSY